MLKRFVTYMSSLFLAVMMFAANAHAELDLTGVSIELGPFETIAKLVLIALGGYATFRFCKKAFG